MSQNTKTKKYNIKTVAIIFLSIILIFLIPNLTTESKLGAKGLLEENQFENRAEAIQKEKENIELEKKQLEIDLKIKELELEKENIRNPLKPIDVEAKEAQVDTELENRKSKINQYLAKYTPNTPLTPEMFIEYSDKYKIPEGFFLAVCHNESHCGTRGRAVKTKNPFNFGNVTEGDDKPTNCEKYSKCLDSVKESFELFANVISNKYFNENEEISLQTWVDRDFIAVRGDVKGYRYMTDADSNSKYIKRIEDLKALQIKY